MEPGVKGKLDLIGRICQSNKPADPIREIMSICRQGEPRIVCLCGSTRFLGAFQRTNLRETLAGKIVLSLGCTTKSDRELLATGELTETVKQQLDELHKHKIYLADEVLVLNVCRYIGSSTREEIDYARTLQKPIFYLEPPPLQNSSQLAIGSLTP